MSPKLLLGTSVTTCDVNCIIVQAIWAALICYSCQYYATNDCRHQTLGDFTFYPYMLIGMLGIYRLLFFCLFVRRILVTDISGVDWRRAMKFCRVIDLGVHQVFSPFGELWPRVSPPGAKK